MILQRVLSALVLAVLLLGILLWAPPSWAVATITLAVAGGAWEWSGFLRAGHALRAAFVIAVGAACWAAWQVTADAGLLRVLLAAAAGWWFLALAWLVLVPPSRLTRPVAFAAGLLALMPAWLALVRLRLDFQDGAYWLLYLLLLVWAADIGAFFAGRRFGHHKLAPAVSPGKTWEGVAGGLVAAALLAGLGAAWFVRPAPAFVALGVVVAGVSVVGDLTESLFKRWAGVKDSGHLIPGHGGIMDRMDSITAAAPCLVLGLLLQGALP